MRAAAEILAAIRSNDLEIACREFAALHGTTLERAVMPVRDTAAVATRHAIWVHLGEEHHMSDMAVSRMWGVDHTSVVYARQKAQRPLASVILEEYPPRPDVALFTFSWIGRAGHQFAVFDATREEARWFATHALGLEVYRALCATAAEGVPTYRKIAAAAAVDAPGLVGLDETTVVLGEERDPLSRSGIVAKGGA